MKSCILLLVVITACNLNTIGHPWTKRKICAPLHLVEAYSQRTIGGVPGGPVNSNVQIVVLWDGRKYPESFFWRGDNGWQTCKMVKAHKMTQRRRDMPVGMDYTAELIDPGKVKMGDTLLLTPVAGGKYPIPGEIPANSKNTLYSKTHGSTILPASRI
jgi:hypothetical protein